MKQSFFCEACGAEVKGRADNCPSCGRSFLGIRCPRCGREGGAGDFIKGCPDCGYMADTKTSSGGLDWPEQHRPKHHRDRSPWPVSRYLVLSGLVVVAVLVILYLWMK